jgi:hypothetical protein
MKTKTNLKAGQGAHTNETLAALTSNHNETLVTGLRVKTAVKAGALNAY